MTFCPMSQDLLFSPKASVKPVFYMHLEVTSNILKAGGSCSPLPELGYSLFNCI